MITTASEEKKPRKHITSYCLQNQNPENPWILIIEKLLEGGCKL
jgi:hypothetical protein